MKNGYMVNLNDILDYLRGKRSGKTANRLEREALSDPFLYEALEGLTEIEANHIEVIEDLERAMRSRIKRHRFSWLGWGTIAACFLVGVTAVWLLVGREQTVPEILPQLARGRQYDSMADSVAGMAVGAKTQEIFLMGDSLASAQEMKRDLSGDKVIYAKKQSGNEAKKTLVQVKTNNGQKVADKVTDAPEKMMSVAASPKIQSASLPDSGQIYKKKLSDVLREKAVVSYRSPRNTVAAGNSGNPDKEGEQLKKENIPVWQRNFERYLNDSLVYPRDARLQRVEGNVQLSVRLNKRGHSSRIKIIKSLFPSCDKEAVRLVQLYNGPLGKEGENRIILTIPFKLD